MRYLSVDASFYSMGLIQEFHQKLADDLISGNFIHQSDLQDLYRKILFQMTINYEQYRKHIPFFLTSLEMNNAHSIGYSIDIFFELYERLIRVENFKPFDLSIMEYVADDDTPEKINLTLRTVDQRRIGLRLSENNFDISNLSDEDKRKMATLIIEMIEKDSEQPSWNNELIHISLTQFVLLRQILASLNCEELFYHVIEIFFDRLASSEYYQAGRDMAEEVIISSYKDSTPAFGYFNSFRFYSNITSIHASLVYANLSLTCILKNEPPYPMNFVKGIISCSMRLFRNVRLFSNVNEIYNEIPTGIQFSDYERRGLDHIYFTSLLKALEPSLPSMLLGYLSINKEAILEKGVAEVLPWLITLYNVRRLYPELDFSSKGLENFVIIFEKIVPASSVKKYKDVINADSASLRTHLKESLAKLNETRDEMDFIYDNENAIMISNRLIEYSIKQRDVSSFLLAMMLKSDYSMLFKSKESKMFVPIALPEINIAELETIYDDNDAFLEKLPVTVDTSISWIAYTDGSLYQLHLFNRGYSFFRLDERAFKAYKELSESDYFINLCFSDTLKDKNGVRSVFPEEFKEEEKMIAKRLSAIKLYFPINANEIHIVKDMEMSKFPHNLFLNEAEDFISKQVPVTNVLSAEWLLRSNGVKLLPASYSRAIWIPIEGGDMALNYLYSNIEEALKKYSFRIFNQIDLKSPLSADLNIVCSHGSKNISETQVLFQANEPIYNLNSVIGRGRVLIFFVCYSGSMKIEFFRNNVASLVKRFIAQGYEAVIAPFWALNATIPRYWLPEFLDSLGSGLTISKAVYNANKKVYEKYPTPVAWACLHLYGNPNLKVMK